MSEQTRPWTWRDRLVVVFYGAPLHIAASLMLAVAAFFGRISDGLSRANNRFLRTFRPGGRRVIPGIPGPVLSPTRNPEPRTRTRARRESMTEIPIPKLEVEGDRLRERLCETPPPLAVTRSRF